MQVGYARVSTGDQSLELQLDALRAAGCERLFTDTASGRIDPKDRPGLEEALRFLRPGDQLLVWKLCRLGRSTVGLIQTLTDLRARGIAFRSLQDPGWDSSTATGQLLFGVLAVLAQYEADLTRERTQAGLAAARARGRVGGRPPALSATQVAMAQKALEAPGATFAQVAELLEVSVSTLKRYLRPMTAAVSSPLGVPAGEHQ